MDWVNLVADIRRGDQTACETLYRELRARQFRHLKRLLDQEAEDALQEAYLFLWSAIYHGAIREPEHLGTYMARTARNAALSIIRRRASRPQVEQSEAANNAVLASPDPVPSIEREIAARETLESAFSSLSDSDVTLLVRNCSEPRGSKYSELSPTLKSRVLRAKRRAVQVIRRLERLPIAA